MPTFEGSTVLSGVKWTYDKNTLTTTMAPASCNKNKDYKQRYKKTWKNKCAYCKKEGTLYPHGTKGGKKAPEGEITCKSCDTDYDGVSGKSKEGKCKYSLSSASSSSTTAVKSESSTNDKKTALSEVKTKYKERSKPKKSFKLVIPPLKGIREGSYIELRPPLVSSPKIFFIGDVDNDNKDMQLTLYDKVPDPGSEYKEETSTATSTTSTTVSGAGSAIEKTIMLKGKELKTQSAIYNWLRKGGGSGGFRYDFYMNHKKGEDVYKFGASSAKYCWNNKIANCVDFAWIFYTMCKGAGIKVNIIQGKGVFPDKTYGHFWNKDKSGKIIDCSAYSCKKYNQTRKVI